MTDVAIDLTDPDTYVGGIPHAIFRHLRTHDPVSWRKEPGGPGFWAVTRHEDVLAVLRAPAIYSSWRGGTLLADPPAEFLEKLRENMLNRDPPDHTVMRRLVNNAFHPRRVAALEAHIIDQARILVDRVRDRGECDFATEIAGQIPLDVICEILGVPVEDRRTLCALTERMFGTEIVDRAAALRDAIAAANELRGYGAELGRRRAARPADDLVSELLAADIDGRRLTQGEFEAFFMLLFNAGSDTTRSLLCFGLDILLERPPVIERLRAEPAALPRTIEEVLRYEPPVIQFRRTATRDASLGERRIREGDKVVVFFPSANRDERVFIDPDRFDPDRTPNDHLAFGHGTHFCLGAPLARMESKHVLSQVLARLPGLERASPLVASRTNFIRSARQLRIRFEAR